MESVEYDVIEQITEKENVLYFKNERNAKEMGESIKNAFAEHGFRIVDYRIGKKNLPDGNILYTLRSYIPDEYFLKTPIFNVPINHPKKRHFKTISKDEAKQEVKSFYEDTKIAKDFFEISAHIEEKKEKFNVVD